MRANFQDWLRRRAYNIAKRANFEDPLRRNSDLQSMRSNSPARSWVDILWVCYTCIQRCNHSLCRQCQTTFPASSLLVSGTDDSRVRELWCQTWARWVRGRVLSIPCSRTQPTERASALKVCSLWHLEEWNYIMDNNNGHKTTTITTATKTTRKISTSSLDTEWKAVGKTPWGFDITCVCVSKWKKKCQMNGKHDKRHRRYFK